MTWLFVLLGAFSLFYWCLLTLKFGLRTSLGYFWLLAAGIFAAGAALPPVQVPFALLLLGGLLFFLGFTLRSSRYPRARGRPDAILVLGVRNDGTQPAALETTRLDVAEALLRQYPSVPVLLSGGRVFGETEPEAARMKRLLLRRGIAPHRILTEENSRTTKENFQAAFPLLPESVGELWVVTASYHCRRAHRIALSTRPPCRLKFVPAPHRSFFLLHLYVREFVTFWVDVFRGNIVLGRLI